MGSGALGRQIDCQEPHLSLPIRGARGYWMPSHSTVYCVVIDEWATNQELPKRSVFLGINLSKDFSLVVGPPKGVGGELVSRTFSLAG